MFLVCHDTAFLFSTCFIYSNSSLIPGSGLFGPILVNGLICVNGEEVSIMAHRVKNPNRLEANHLVIYKSHQEDKLGITENKSS